MKTIHHNLPKNAGGSNEQVNKTEINDRFHNNLHLLVNTMPPHQIIEFIIRITGKPLKDDVKNKILEILKTDKPEELYKPNAIKDLNKFRKEVFKYLRITYIKV